MPGPHKNLACWQHALAPKPKVLEAPYLSGGPVPAMTQEYMFLSAFDVDFVLASQMN